MHNKLKNGDEVAEPQISESISLNPGERTSIVGNYPLLDVTLFHVPKKSFSICVIIMELLKRIIQLEKNLSQTFIVSWVLQAKTLPGSLSNKALAVVEALEGKVCSWLLEPGAFLFPEPI